MLSPRLHEDEDLDPYRQRRQRYRRNVRYATPVAGDESGELWSVTEVASARGLSPRQVFRLAKTGELRPIQHNPMLFAGADVREWSARWADKQAFRRNRKKTISDLMRSRPALTPAAARQAEYRKRMRTER